MVEQDVPVIEVSDEYTIYAAEQTMLPFMERDCSVCRGQGCSECQETGWLTCWVWTDDRKIRVRDKKNG